MNGNRFARLARIVPVLLICLTGVSGALAQEVYPSRPIRLLIPFAPGGATDLFARKYAERLGKKLGQPVLPDNKAGASGVIAATETVRSKPNGYTLFFGTASTLAILPSMTTTPPYDVEKDFIPVALIGKNPLFLVVHPALPARSVGEFVALVKANPGKYSYGTSGTGSTNHLAGELFKRQAGNLDLLHVPYKGSGPALQDALAGVNQVLFDTFSGSWPFHKAGKLRMLAILAEKRFKLAPDLPTAIEAGIPGMVGGSFQLVCAPHATPAAIIDTLQAATAEIMRDPAFQTELESLAFDPVADSTPEKAKQFIRSEVARWAPIVKATGVKLE